MNDYRNALAHRILDRYLVGQISRDHFDRALDASRVWTGEAPTLDDVNELIAASGSTRLP